MRILYCGGGALGSHALLLGRDLGAELAVIDDDRVETKNLGSQWFVRQMVGKNKATALKGQMLNFYNVPIRDYPVRLSSLNIETVFAGFDLIVDCFDNAASRRLVQDYVRKHELPCLHGGLAPRGEFGAVRWEADFIVDEEDEEGGATCEGEGYLPLISRVSAALVQSVRSWLIDGTMRSWNVSPSAAESF